MLVAPAVVSAQDILAAQGKKTAAAKTVKSGRIEGEGIQYHYPGASPHAAGQSAHQHGGDGRRYGGNS